LENNASNKWKKVRIVFGLMHWVFETKNPVCCESLARNLHKFYLFLLLSS
jgi:hypothetical protein